MSMQKAWTLGCGGTPFKNILTGTRRWRIRPYDNRDYAAVVEVQTESFHITNPVPFLNQLIYTNFRAEVVDALRQKTKYSDPGRFQLLVAEESLLPGRPQPHTAAAAAATVVNTAIASSGVDDSGLSITRSSSSSSHSYHEDSSASSCSGAAQLVGSVEVSLMCEREVLRALPRNPLGEYVYISSMCVRSSQRRRGVAQVLMAAAEAQARRWGQPRLALHVFKDNAPAVELYRKCGMRVIGEDPAWKAMLGGKVRLLMYKELILEGQETGVEQR
ncbi:hypothetical protein VOLCADRAFT_86458 [Volvox carteri f. nagariensis]|uniref:N-acetyltransferase domain-containing protein n=1 Tax=Volvox carteri f. nagariensis TaxID=3068 RepID=D8TIU3_VOLCA|nr:uncharacterized protein VOLCADRAFT_86458 [Volvox carteri f. nagariensis]EFJ53304.1 hypothetical protein VOLCADRAFT_86458 [Volvox carteri f. nagariensis]|eukprot:XP_002946309.1 hypothetical protein VOLCADRAFT_86458 [Volvox carteri f. nagariensis]